MTNKGGFSWKRITGVTAAKQRISRATGVPMTKNGRQRKLGAMMTGSGKSGSAGFLWWLCIGIWWYVLIFCWCLVKWTFLLLWYMCKYMYLGVVFIAKKVVDLVKSRKTSQPI